MTTTNDEAFHALMKRINPAYCETDDTQFTRHMRQAWQARVPEGYVVVPREPTEKILEAVWGRPLDQFDHGARRIAKEKYRELIAAAEGEKNDI